MILLATTYARYQLRITLSVSFLCLSCGAFLGYTSSAIHSMNEDNTFPSLTVSEVAWIGSLGPLGAVCGCLFTAAAIPSLGPRRTIFAFGAPCFIVSWFGIYFADSAKGICISRFIGGLGTGITTCSAPLYVIGIASIQNRGRLGVLPQLLMLIGIVISYCLGSTFNWANHAMMCCLLVIPTIILIPFAPDTPRWLLNAERPEDALTILEKLNDKMGAAEEYNRLRNQDISRQTQTIKLNWRKPYVIKSILTALGIMTFQQLSGINGVTFYAVTIFKQSPGVNTWGAYIPAIILAVVQCIASVTSTFVIDKAGRKILLMISASMTCLASGGIGIYFLLVANEMDLFWIPLTILMVFAFGFAIGYGAVSWLLVTEILPEEIRHVINPFVLAYTWLCVFGVTKSFPYLLGMVNIYGIFWMYALFSLMGLFFVSFFVPETKGKSFEEVRQAFKGGSMTKL